ncbi:hypothetical protein [Lactonifactor longoviformis]|uniref:Uncharacterized protein n=2 Tax=Lactonifactor TaxID=420345 RepID=A0A1M4Y575_9CLOT|nr:hypothetical protein [Lactonifactor longoviformis]SHF00855.1 hypothetical protein SAMN02745158_02259 [Lactonifactor longoviformis DSM 17459]
MLVKELVKQKKKNTTVDFLGQNYWQMIIDVYSNQYIKTITAAKYGTGASDFIVKGSTPLRHKLHTTIYYA